MNASDLNLMRGRKLRLWIFLTIFFFNDEPSTWFLYKYLTWIISENVLSIETVQKVVRTNMKNTNHDFVINFFWIKKYVCVCVCLIMFLKNLKRENFLFVHLLWRFCYYWVFSRKILVTRRCFKLFICNYYISSTIKLRRI